MWPNPQFPADMVTFTEEILNGKLHFLCSDSPLKLWIALVFIEILDFRWILIIRDNFLEHFWGKDEFSSWYIGWSILLRLTIRCTVLLWNTSPLPLKNIHLFLSQNHDFLIISNSWGLEVSSVLLCSIIFANLVFKNILSTLLC